MKITKRADGRYCAKVTKDGVSKYVYGKTQKEVENKLVDFKYMANKGIIIDDNRLDMNQLAETWFNICQKQKSSAQKKRNKGLIDNYIIPKFNHYRITNIKPYMIEELLNDIIAQGKNNTAKKVHQVLHSMLELAVNNDWLVKNPIKSIKAPVSIPKEKKPLTLEERLILENSTNKYKDFFTFLLYTGLRRGEACALTWNDIDFKNKTICVNKSIDFSETNKGVKKSTKNGKARIIPMLDKTYEILASMPHINDYVFTNQHKKPLTEISIKRMSESFKKDTGLDFTLHQLRHTFCTMLYYSGISSKKAQQIMGHSSLDVTLKIYTHLDEEQEENTLQKLNDYTEKLSKARLN